jgi:aryl-alcohol dehydrogenase-like predicted oxidoreductase
MRNAPTRRQVRRCQTREKLRPRAPTLGAIAVAWTLRHQAVDGAIVGFRYPDQIDPILAGAKLELSDEDLEQINGGAR